MICVNKISNEGLVEDYVTRTEYNALTLGNMARSKTFSSDKVFDTRIDFPLSKDTKFSTLAIGTMVLEVVDSSKVKSGVIKRDECIGCMKGAGCIRNVQSKTDIASLTLATLRDPTEKEVGRPHNTQSFLALYAGDKSRDIFYDKNTFGFLLTTNNGVGGINNNNHPGCAVFPDTGRFRNNWLPNGQYDGPNFGRGTNLPDSHRRVQCTNSFSMDPNGGVYRFGRANTRDDIPAGGTFWVGASAGTGPSVDLFGCDINQQFIQRPNTKQDSGVEHIIEKSLMKGKTPSNEDFEQFPLVDFVMAWQYWNGENGSFRESNGNEDAAENEKKKLYGEGVYSCIESLLGGILLSNTDDTTVNSCQETVWRSPVCQSALLDVDARQKLLDTFLLQ